MEEESSPPLHKRIEYLREVLTNSTQPGQNTTLNNETLALSRELDQLIAESMNTWHE